MARCLLALGSNLGDRQAILANACYEVTKLPKTQLLARSQWHGTVPIGGSAGQGEFLNGSILVETGLGPQTLAKKLHEIEAGLGRKRIVRWDARILDIDLLLYERECIESDELTVPHPRMSFRRFVLEPAVEIAGFMLHPTSGWTIAGLLDHLHRSARRVVVTATQKPLAEWLAAQLCQTMICTQIASSQKNNSGEGTSVPVGSIEFANKLCGKPPTIEIRPPGLNTISEPMGRSITARLRPALTIFLDVVEPTRLGEQAVMAGFMTAQASSDWPTTPPFATLGKGPLARITIDDPAIVMQESQAALRCVWPDLS